MVALVARRAVLATLSAACVLRPRLPALADDAPPLAEAAPPKPPQLIGTGTVRIQAGATPTDSPTAALYVTARLVPSNVAPLYVTAGKVPPLAAARFPAPTFPFDFKLDATNLTPEWAGVAPAEWAVPLPAHLRRWKEASVQDMSHVTGLLTLHIQNTLLAILSHPLNIHCFGGFSEYLLPRVCFSIPPAAVRGRRQKNRSPPETILRSLQSFGC